MRCLIVAVATIAGAGTMGAQTSAKASLLDADATLSFAAFDRGPISAFPSALGSDGTLAWPGGTAIHGMAGATKFFASQPLLTVAKISWQPFRVEISPDSSLALLTGVATLDRKPTDPVPQIHRIGRYMAAWQRNGDSWHLVAFGFVNLFTKGETIWRDAIGPRELPAIQAKGMVAKVAAADSMFATDAAAMGASKAFAKWAAPDGVTMAATGELNVGPARIGAVLASNTGRWHWITVAAGASTDGALGWTISQTTILPPGPGPGSKSNLMTLWRRMPDGTLRFTALGGMARP